MTFYSFIKFSDFLGHNFSLIASPLLPNPAILMWQSDVMPVPFYGRKIFIHVLIFVNRWTYRVYLGLWRVKMAIYMYPNPMVARTTNDGTVL